MKTSILWNGFEIQKGDIETSVGFVPYLCYIPENSNSIVNIAIHGEGHEKEDWLCFNSELKLGNLLKEAIKNSSAFIAFDLYGHGDWIIKNKNFNNIDLSELDEIDFILRSRTGIQEAIPIILKNENLMDKNITLTSFSLGCSIALGLNLNKGNFKMVLISPYYTPAISNCKNYLIAREKQDQSISEDDLQYLLEELPQNTILQKFLTKSDLSQNWINYVKSFIYSNTSIA